MSILPQDPFSPEQQAQSRFQTIFEQSPFSIQIFSIDGKTKLVNKAWQRMWGLSDEIIQQFILTEYNVLNDPILKENGVLEYIQRGFAGEASVVPRIHYNPEKVGFNAKACWVESTIYPLKNSRGEVTEVVIMHIDVTQEHRTQVAQVFLSQISSILMSSLDSDQILEKLTETIVHSFADGCVIDLIENEEIQSIICKHRTPEIQQYMDELKNYSSLTHNSPQSSSRVIKSGTPEIIEIVNEEEMKTHSWGQKHQELMQKIGIKSYLAVPLEIRGRIIGALNLMLTTTERRFDQHDLSTSLELAQKASVAIENARLYRNLKEALKQRDEFISVASHELKTPITSLKLQMQVAARLLEKNPDDALRPLYMKKLTENANSQLDRLTRLVEDMLDISRIATGKLPISLKVINLTELTREVLGRFLDQFKELEIPCQQDLEEAVHIKCDPYRIEQVITNLISNAIRYGKNLPIIVSLKHQQDKVLLQVQDHGIGIAPGDLERIFNRFERAISSSDVSGLGLGLYISKEIVTAHGGRIWVESEFGRGTIFTIELKKV